MAKSKTVGRNCSKCGAIFQGDSRDASLPMLCPTCKAKPSVEAAPVTFTAVAEPVTAPELIAMQQPVVVEPTTIAEPPPVVAVPAPAVTGASVKCSMCATMIAVAELDPRCLLEKPMCKVCLAEFEQFLGAPPQPVDPPAEPVPPIEVSGEVTSDVVVEAESEPSPMEEGDVYTQSEQPFVKHGLLYLTGKNGRIIIRPNEWTAFETSEQQGMVWVYIDLKSTTNAFEVVGTPERIVEAFVTASVATFRKAQGYS